MRQAGFLGAAGLIALKDMTKRLKEDHDNAKYLAQRLEEIPNIKVDRDNLDINLVFFKIENCPLSSEEMVNIFSEKGIKINGPEGGKMRFATHYWVNKEDIDYVVEVMKSILK
ncbi:L-allo-threonine aldolase [compost metagenome]